MSRKSLLQAGRKFEGEVTATGIEHKTTSILIEHSNICPNWPNDWAVFWVLTCTVDFTVCSSHVRYGVQNESTLYNSLNVKQLLPRSRRKIYRWSDCNWTRTKNHLVLKRKLKHVAKLTKGLSCVLSTYLYGAFDCIFLSCHVRSSEWINTV